MIKGFKMKLYPGMEAEYEKRHNELWPEMKDMIHEHGGSNYTIFLDKETLTLFGYIEITDEKLFYRHHRFLMRLPRVSLMAVMRVEAVENDSSRRSTSDWRRDMSVCAWLFRASILLLHFWMNISV